MPAWADCNADAMDGEETPLFYNSAHCGACNVSVDEPFAPTGFGYCDAGTPRLLGCELGWRANVDGTACDVCDSYLGGADVPDNGLDENCTSGDSTADESRGFFVDAVNGEDAADRGTRAAPFRTLVGVMDYGWPASPNRKELYLAAGTYADTLVAPQGAQVHGGFINNNGTWSRSSDRSLTVITAGTGFDFRHPSTTTPALYVVDTLTIRQPGAGPYRAIHYAGYVRLYVQEVDIELQGNNCYGVSPEHPADQGVIEGYVGIFNVNVAGPPECYALGGADPGYGVSTNVQLRAYGVNSSAQFGNSYPAASTWTFTRVTAPRFMAQSTTSTRIELSSFPATWNNLGNDNYADINDPTFLAYRSTLGPTRTKCSLSSICVAHDVSLTGASSDGWIYMASFLGGSLDVTGSVVDIGLIHNADIQGRGPSTGYLNGHEIQDSHLWLSGNEAIQRSASYFDVAVFERNRVRGGAVFNPTMTLIRNNVFQGSSTGAVVTLYGDNYSVPTFTFSNNTVLSTAGASCLGVRASGPLQTLAYNNVVACTSTTAGNRVALEESDTSAEFLGIQNNVLAGVDVLFKDEGATSISSLTVLNTSASLNADGRGGNTKLPSADDVLFVDLLNLDLRVMESSPAVNGGTNTSEEAKGGVTEDILLQARPCGSAHDVGAYEHCTGP
ncbi:MAG: choice-of-anchor Q domain-containing protein [Myxococcota bacterium]